MFQPYQCELSSSDILIQQEQLDKQPLVGRMVERCQQGMRRQKRNTLFFVDNAPSHPHVTLSNVMVVFLPPNTTSVIKPINQGRIQTLKLKFYQQQSQRIISEMDNTSLSGSELLKKITVLETIYWIGRAWNSVDASTTIKCLNK